MWSGEVLKSLDSAEQDASSAILYDPDNAKVSFHQVEIIETNLFPSGIFSKGYVEAGAGPS